MAMMVDGKLLPYYVGQFFGRQKLLNGQFPNWDHEFGAKNFEFGLEPAITRRDFHGIWNTVATGIVFSRETSADGRHVNGCAEVGFGNSANGFEPPKKGPARRPCEGSAKDRLFAPGRLAHGDNLAKDRSAGDRRPMHFWAELAVAQLKDQLIELALWK